MRKRRKLIVVHSLGSHPDACDRIIDYKKIINNTNKTFSLIYFSDHGMVHQKVNDIIYMNNSTISQFHYDIPLFNISSDSKERKFCKSFKSGLNFINGIGNWLGIVNSNLDGEYDLFDCMSDKNDYGLLKKIDDILSPHDYAVNIS